MPWTVEHTARNVATVRIDVPDAKWEQWFLLSSDRHHDNPKCDHKAEKKHLDLAVERNAGIIDAGDLFCAMQMKFDKRGSKSAIREEDNQDAYLDRLVENAGNFYGPYAQNWIVMGQGNHETAILKRNETNLTDRLVERIKTDTGHKVQCGGYGGWVRFMFTIRGTRRDQRLLHYFHGTGGGGPVTRGVIQTNRLAVFNPDADIVLSGHTHDEWVVPIRRQRMSSQGVPYHDEQVHVRTPGYKDSWQDGYGGWEVERMMGPKPKGAAWLKFFIESDELRMEVQRAA